MTRAVVGMRIRERRRALGMTQAGLAARIGISPSYMNLIERNRRAIAGSLLRRAAEALALGLDDLDGAAERRLLDALVEIAHAPELARLGVETEGAGELIARFPGWARALASLARSEREASATAGALADRLTHDPFLGETVHRMLTRIAAIRSAAEILQDFPNVPDGQRDRFHRIMHEESRALSQVGEALAGYFDKIVQPGRKLTPLDEVEALFDARANRLDEIETAAAALADDLTEYAPSRRQAQALTMAQDALRPIVDALFSGQSEVETAAGLARARATVTDYAAAAILVPMPRLVLHAAALRYDVEALAEAFAVGVETICRRLAALPRGEGVPRFGHFRANAAGTIVERSNLPGLAAPRYATACPLWLLYRAQQSPETMLRQRVVFPTGDRFVFLARARNTGTAGFGQPRHYRTDMLALTEEDARLTVYAAGPAVPAEEVGNACRLCPRQGCGHRVEDPIDG